MRAQSTNQWLPAAQAVGHLYRSAGNMAAEAELIGKLRTGAVKAMATSSSHTYARTVFPSSSPVPIPAEEWQFYSRRHSSLPRGDADDALDLEGRRVPIVGLCTISARWSDIHFNLIDLAREFPGCFGLGPSQNSAPERPARPSATLLQFQPLRRNS